MRKSKIFKIMTMMMILCLLPIVNFDNMKMQENVSISPALLKNVFSSNNALADTSNVTSSSFSGQSIAQPARTALPTNPVIDATKPSDFGYQASISSLNPTGLMAIQNGNVVYSNSAVTDTTVQAALYTLYGATNASSSDDVLYFGANYTMGSAIAAKAVVSGPSATNMTFSTLSNHAKSLTFVSNPADNLTSSNTAQASGTNYTITTPTNVYFGVPTIFRNVTFAAGGDNIYAQGNSFATTNGSWITGAPNIYGGTDSTNISGDTNLYIAATGNTAGWDIYGGNATGGTISGNTHVTLVQASTTISNITGGSAAGATISGNTNLDINSAIAAQITNIFGAGIGTSSSPVTVNGNATTVVKSANGSARYQLYQGGTAYGNISGSIYNSFSGAGGWNGSSNINGSNGTFSDYNGGSFQGNIGTSGAGNVISNSYDTSSFTTGQALFVGGNGGTLQSYGAATATSTAAQGTTYANITNYIKSAFSTGTAGAVYGVVGGNGHDSLKISPAQWGLGTSTTLDYGASSVDAKAYAQIPSATVIANAQKITTNAIYGNIYTWEQSGVMSTTAGGGYNDWTGYSYGASSNGYLQGQSVLEAGTSNTDNSVGGSGVVYCTAMGGTAETALSAQGTVAYSKTDTTSANNSGWDLWGGGGTVYNYRQAFLQNGNSYLIHNNDISRWTYGGQSNGSQVGNSYNILNGGIVDTLEGGGYCATTKWGSTAAQVNMGQVNWFLSGGSWGDLYNTGNATVNVYNGTINAIAGGNYGQAGTETIAGNSTVNIYGGDFSGTPRTGTKQLCGGPFFNGSSSILGNTTLNLDLTGPTASTFKLPTGTDMSGGAGYGNTATHVGSGSSNSINLNITANAATGNVLNGAVLYGDGQLNGYSSTYTNVGTINMNINADGSTVGSVYGTNYSEMPSTGQIFNTNIEIGDGTTIAGTVSSGGTTDNLTDAIAAANTKQSMITLGNGTSLNPIIIQGSLTNFNSATLLAGATLHISGSGAFLNGANAKASTHGASYATHGSLTMGANSTLDVDSSSLAISMGKLTTNTGSRISTPYLQNPGVINLSDLDQSNGSFIWLPIGAAPTTISNTYTGAYWGKNAGFPVFTFTGGNSATGIQQIKPGNFYGIDAANNYSFLGDYTTTASGSYPMIGYVLPGQIRQYTTTGDANSGNWQYNLAGVTTGTPTAGTVMNAWASVSNQTNSSTITLMYTMNYVNTTSSTPFSFTANSPYYIKSRQATDYLGNVMNAYPDITTNFDTTSSNLTGAIRNFSTGDYFTGSNLNGVQTPAVAYGAYIVNNVVTDNSANFTSGNIIISSSTAKTMTLAKLEDLMQVKGTGVLSDLTIPSNVLTTINEGLPTGSENAKNVEVDWSNGMQTNSQNVTIVPDDAVISSDGQTALNAEDASMTDVQAQVVSSQADIDTQTNALAYNADGSTQTATLSNPSDLISQLNAVTISGQFAADYSYGNLTKNVTISVNAGKLELTSAPGNIDFGAQHITSSNLMTYPQDFTDDSGNPSNIVVTDTRTGDYDTPWEMTVTQTQALTSGENSLDGDLYYNDGTTSTVLSNAPVVVYEENSGQDGTFTINQNWGNSTQQGIYLNIPVSQQKAGDYQGQLTWSLSAVPGN